MQRARNNSASTKVRVKDDEGYHTVSTEHGASPSQVAEAKKIRTPYLVWHGMVGEASDAISAYTFACLKPPH